MTALVFELAYQLRLHRVGGWALDRWAVTLVWGTSVLILTQWMWRGQPVLPAWHWLILALLLLGGVAVLILRGWARRRSYVVFTPDPGLTPPAPAPLPPDEKIPLRATGRFEVNDKTRLFANLTAYWRSYASREHAVLAARHRTRFLLVHSPGEDAGMWYIFIRPEVVEAVAPGRLRYGARSAPALRVVYRWQPPSVEGKRPPKPFSAAAYLAFEDEPAREAVWADLMADSPRIQAQC